MCERRNTMLIDELNKYGENNNIEVKKEVPAEHKKYLKSVVAFANGFGGKIIFGIEEKQDSFEVCGLSGDILKSKIPSQIQYFQALSHTLSLASI